MVQSVARGMVHGLALRGALAVMAAVLGPGWAQAAPGLSTKNPGPWTLSREDGSRQCVVTLRAEPVESGYAIGMPVGCHRAFPVLATVVAWLDVGEGKLQFEDASGQPVLAFDTGADGGLSATSPSGETYRLRPVGAHKSVVLKAPAGAAAKTGVAAPGVPAETATPPKVADMPGYYAVLRDKTKDTGCMVTFDDNVPGPGSSLKAHLAPACRDEGSRSFDPVGWQVQHGRLVLIARKGHSTHLDFQADGSWMKDPSEGKTLSLKKMGSQQ